MLGQLLNICNRKYNRSDPVKMINLSGKISKFIIRVGRRKIPNPTICIAMLEKKLFEYIM
jgi:hypothetical protein